MVEVEDEEVEDGELGEGNAPMSHCRKLLQSINFSAKHGIVINKLIFCDHSGTSHGGGRARAGRGERTNEPLP